MKPERFMDASAVVHAGASDGIDYTLCGVGLDGADGVSEMTSVNGRIDCADCLRIIAYCKAISGYFLRLRQKNEASR